MNTTIHDTGKTLGRADIQVLGSNIEAYENTIPCMLSDRLRNAKFAGPENHQTGVAVEWEPIGNGMQGMSCRLLSGMYMSGREAQLVHHYAEHGTNGILQAGITVREGETFDVELWARAQHRPVTVALELRLPGQEAPQGCRDELIVEQAHWHRVTGRLASPGDGGATLFVRIPGDSRLIIDQIHLRPTGEGHVSQALLNAFDRFPCPVLRFPGGCVTCTYHWEHGTGPVHLRPVCDDPVFKYKLHYDFGTDEYLDLCMARGIRPFITLNTTTATPENAAAWAAYVRRRYVERGKPIPPAYIMFGNENYGAWEIGHMTGDMYAAQLHAFVPAVRAAYPEARMLAIGEFGSAGLRDAYRTDWRNTVIQKAAGLFDALVVTRYARTTDSLTFEEAMQAVAEGVAEKAADFDRQVHSIRDARLDCTIGIVEWNYWTRANHNDHAGFYEPNDIRHCLYSAGLLNVFCRLCERLEVANYYSLVNTMGMIHIHDGRVTLSDVVKVFNLYAPALPGEVLELESDVPAPAAADPAVDVLAVNGTDGLFVFLVNYSASKSTTVDLGALGAVGETIGLRADAILAPVQDIVPETTESKVTIPPAAVVRVQIGSD